MGAARAPADTSSDAQQRDQEKRGAPAAPPAPDRTRRARRATPTSGRSRRSWPNPPQTHHGAIRRTTTRPPKQGLRIRPQSGYSSVRHLCGLLTEPGGRKAADERPGCHPVFLVSRRLLGRPARAECRRAPLRICTFRRCRPKAAQATGGLHVQPITGFRRVALGPSAPFQWERRDGTPALGCDVVPSLVPRPACAWDLRGTHRASIEGKPLQAASTRFHLRRAGISTACRGLPGPSTPGQEMGRGGFEPPSVGL
jgi:hypothetical protein